MDIWARLRRAGSCPPKGGLVKNLYTKSEKQTPTCRMTRALYETVNLYNIYYNFGGYTIMSLGFFIDLILRTSDGLWVDSVCNRNEYRGYLLWDKGGRCVGLTTLPTVKKFWEPQPPETLKACTGIALPSR